MTTNVATKRFIGHVVMWPGNSVTLWAMWAASRTSYPQIVDSADVCFVPTRECTFCLLFFLCAELFDLAGSGASARKIYIIKYLQNPESIKNEQSYNIKFKVFLFGTKILENIRQTQRIDKGNHKHPFANLLRLTEIFEIFRPEEKYFGLYVVTLLIFYGFLKFWTFFYVDFPCGGA